MSHEGAQLDIGGTTHVYDGNTVLDNLNLQIKPGSFVAVLGASGSGKSTLLRLIAGLEEPTAGGIDVHADGHRAVTRVMFQEDRLLPWKTVLHNVQVGTSGKAARARELLQHVGLAGREENWPSELSGGQRQRVAVARALLHQPDLLLLDEPFGALDAITRITMQQLLESLWLEHPRTVVLVTHDVEEALILADRVLVLGKGRIVRDLDVSGPRPKHRGDAALAALKEELLDGLLAAHTSSSHLSPDPDVTPLQQGDY